HCTFSTGLPGCCIFLWPSGCILIFYDVESTLKSNFSYMHHIKNRNFYFLTLLLFNLSFRSKLNVIVPMLFGEIPLPHRSRCQGHYRYRQRWTRFRACRSEWQRYVQNGHWGVHRRSILSIRPSVALCAGYPYWSWALWPLPFLP